MHAKSTIRSRGGFTLVEILVAIGIIAILISILLPSLAKARAAANSVACLSNLRQIGLATQMYAQDNNDYLPYLLFFEADGVSHAHWSEIIRSYFGDSKAPTATAGAPAIVKSCPSFDRNEAVGWEAGYGMVGQLGLPNNTSRGRSDGCVGWRVPGIDWPPVKLLSLRDSSTRIVFGDSQNWFIGLGGWQNSPPMFFAGDGAPGRHSAPSAPGQATTQGKANYCFADGHAETPTGMEVARLIAVK